jgi:hypothetical protein
MYYVVAYFVSVSKLYHAERVIFVFCSTIVLPIIFYFGDNILLSMNRGFYIFHFYTSGGNIL